MCVCCVCLVWKLQTQNPTLMKFVSFILNSHDFHQKKVNIEDGTLVQFIL